MTAAACAGRGLTAHLFFFERRPRQLRGNLLLNQLCGANLHFIPLGGGQGNLTLEMTNRLVRIVSLFATGAGAYFMPVGGHNVTGCLGYVDAARELHEQIMARDLPLGRTTIVTAAGTGGTLAGLVAGLALVDSPLQVLGLDIGKLWKGFSNSLARLATALCRRLGVDRTFRPEEIPLIEATYAGPGYAAVTPSTVAAIRVLAEAEGVILDPVYTGKAFAGLLDLVRRGRFSHEEEIVFLHTGGLPAIWEFAAQLNSGLHPVPQNNR
jgi:1-aminocyclopropane-1-carboxylate deaminase/D-cysteine desulfhydrase-like pyridoxal-dependent ACC family enzyme